MHDRPDNLLECCYLSASEQLVARVRQIKVGRRWIQRHCSGRSIDHAEAVEHRINVRSLVERNAAVLLLNANSEAPLSVFAARDLEASFDGVNDVQHFALGANKDDIVDVDGHSNCAELVDGDVVRELLEANGRETWR